MEYIIYAILLIVVIVISLNEGYKKRKREEHEEYLEDCARREREHEKERLKDIENRGYVNSTKLEQIENVLITKGIATYEFGILVSKGKTTK